MPPGRVLIFAGLVLIVLGLLISIGFRIHLPFGRLPGDIFIRRENFSFSFPIVTCLMVSLLITLLFNLFFRK